MLSTLRAVSEIWIVNDLDLSAPLPLPNSRARRSACRLSGSPAGPGVVHFGGTMSPGADAPSAAGRGGDALEAIELPRSMSACVWGGRGCSSLGDQRAVRFSSPERASPAHPHSFFIPNRLGVWTSFSSRITAVLEGGNGLEWREWRVHSVVLTSTRPTTARQQFSPVGGH